MLCALSGQTPEVPVVSSTGYLFEKSLIEKYIEANGKCPITNEPLSQNDLTPLKASRVARPRPTTATSIPSMLHLFQNEWDAVMLECFTLKQHLETCRQELAHALYQNDAACRVIARLMRERDEAKTALANVQTQLASAGVQAAAAPSAMEVDGARMPESVQAELRNLSKELSGERKKRKNKLESFPDLAKPEQVARFTSSAGYPVHKASVPGITCLAVHPELPNLILTGGADKEAVLFNRATQKKLATLTGHSKKVTDVCLHPTQPLALTASNDKTVRIYRNPTAWDEGRDSLPTPPLHGSLTTHKGPLVSLSLHPSGKHVITASADRSWAFHDIETLSCLAQVASDRGEGYTCGQVHPDGLIFATGTADNQVKIWDVTALNHVHTFKQHTAPISSLAFSENGYILATASEDGVVKLWDLRHLKNPHLHTIQVADADAGSSLPTVVTFDSTGTYMGVACNRALRVYHNFRDVTEALRIPDAHTDTITDLAFGANASFIATTSMDRHLKIWQ